MIAAAKGKTEYIGYNMQILKNMMTDFYDNNRKCEIILSNDNNYYTNYRPLITQNLQYFLLRKTIKVSFYICSLNQTSRKKIEIA